MIFMLLEELKYETLMNFWCDCQYISLIVNKNKSLSNDDLMNLEEMCKIKHNFRKLKTWVAVFHIGISVKVFTKWKLISSKY